MIKTVLVKMSGRIEMEVEGGNKQEILQNADSIISEMDFGQLEDIEWVSEIAPWSD